MSLGATAHLQPLPAASAIRYRRLSGSSPRSVFSCGPSGKHIKDLTVCSEPEPPPPAMAAYPHDPAIVSVDVTGPSTAPPGPGPAALLRPGVGAPPHAVGGPSVPSPVFGGLGGASNEIAEPCCAPVSPQARGPLHQPQIQQPPSDGLTGGSGQQGSRQQTFSGARGSPAGRGGGRSGRGRGGRDGRRPSRGGDGGRGYGDGPRGVVGELQSRPNAQLKSEVAEEFDFDAMNSKFEKPGMRLAATACGVCWWYIRVLLCIQACW